MPIELVVFDLAGTTVKDDKDVHKVLQKALAAHGVNVSIDDANTVMGIPKPVAIRQLLGLRYMGPKDITPEWIDEIHVLFVREMIHFYETDPGVGEKFGVTETFKKLKQSNLMVAVDTGFDRQITAPLLDRLGWKSLIDASVTSDEVERGRPYPDLIFRAMQLTNITDARNVAKVGDTISDIEEGKAAGCGWVVGVTTGSFSREQLLDAKPTHLIENVSELLAILSI
ncbi:MAG: HAD hydrolase-like protein [Chryseolinea sp.]